MLGEHIIVDGIARALMRVGTMLRVARRRCHLMLLAARICHWR